MQKVTFAELPGLVQLSSMATLFIGWVLFAELVIDRHGYDRFLPLYRVANVCPYDFAVVLVLAAIWLGLRRRQSGRA